MHRLQQRGFTIIELILALSIVVVITVAATLNLQGGKTSNDLTSTTKQIQALLREAQSDAVAQENHTAWGVHFENATTTTPFYALFDASSYSTSSIVGQYTLPRDVAYTPATIASGNTLDVIFSQITGAPNATATIGLYAPYQTSISSTLITVGPTGAVNY